MLFRYVVRYPIPVISVFRSKVLLFVMYAVLSAPKSVGFLARQCEGHCTVATDKALSNLKAGELPVKNMVGPRRPNRGQWQPAAPEQCIVVSHLPLCDRAPISSLNDPNMVFEEEA